MQNSPKERSPSNERNQYFLGCAYSVPHDASVPMDAHFDTTDHRGSITKDVSRLRIDHIAESPLCGVWRDHSLNALV